MRHVLASPRCVSPCLSAASFPSHCRLPRIERQVSQQSEEAGGAVVHADTGGGGGEERGRDSSTPGEEGVARLQHTHTRQTHTRTTARQRGLHSWKLD